MNACRNVCGNAVEVVAFSPDGHILAGGYLDGTVRLWNVADPAHARLASPSLASGDRADAVAFSPDGHTLASGAFDGRSGCGMSPTRRTPDRPASRSPAAALSTP